MIFLFLRSWRVRESEELCVHDFQVSHQPVDDESSLEYLIAAHYVCCWFDLHSGPNTLSGGPDLIVKKFCVTRSTSSSLYDTFCHRPHLASRRPLCAVEWCFMIPSARSLFFWKMKLKTFSISSSSHSHCSPLKPVLCVSFASKRAARNRAFVSFVIWS